MYHWQEEIETANEIPILIKAKSALFGEIQATIRKYHPYDVPEIVALPIKYGDQEYLKWIDAVSNVTK